MNQHKMSGVFWQPFHMSGETTHGTYNQSLKLETERFAIVLGEPNHGLICQKGTIKLQDINGVMMETLTVENVTCEHNLSKICIHDFKEDPSPKDDTCEVDGITRL